MVVHELIVVFCVTFSIHREPTEEKVTILTCVLLDRVAPHVPPVGVRQTRTLCVVETVVTYEMLLEFRYSRHSML